MIDLLCQYHDQGLQYSIGEIAHQTEILAELTAKAAARYEALHPFYKLTTTHQNPDSAHNEYARRHNIHFRGADQPREPLHDFLTNETIENFPVDAKAIDEMKEGKVEVVLRALGLPVFHELGVKKELLKVWIGL